MEKLTLDLPSLYGDHHVVEVRRLLLELPGVEEVYASSCFHLVEVSFDPDQITADAIRAKLDEAGYTEELPIPHETGVSAYAQDGRAVAMRHTTAYEQVGTVVSFAQHVSYSGRPLWPCPGLGVIRREE